MVPYFKECFWSSLPPSSFVLSCTHQDDCGNDKGTFSVRVESVPCCDEALTCSRTIILQLQVNDPPYFTATNQWEGFKNLSWLHFFFGPSSVMHDLIECVNLCFPPKGTVTLTLSDVKVTRRHHDGWSPGKDLLYSIHTVGLYIVISVPSRGLTLIWDKHTRVTVELHAQWRVSHQGFARKISSLFFFINVVISRI